ncbi:hypothetical protein NL676_029518 [Syzygium grande]|nr:hypothetical protein NL676_029518 [Syzygium grande]
MNLVSRWRFSEDDNMRCVDVSGFWLGSIVSQGPTTKAEASPPKFWCASVAFPVPTLPWRCSTCLAVTVECC